jgi:hypothetical protein
MVLLSLAEKDRNLLFSFLLDEFGVLKYAVTVVF